MSIVNGRLADMRLAVTLTRIPSLIPAAIALAAVCIFGVWTAHDGGFEPEEWLPGALLMLGLLLAALAAPEARARLRAAPTAPIFLGLYVLWSYASIFWAQVRGDALDGANRTLLYFCVFVLFCALPLGARARVVIVSCWGIAVAVIGCIALARAAVATGPEGHFVLGRLASPITYPNANAAVFVMAFLPLQVLASRRQAHPIFRIAAGSACAALVDLALLSESRGSLVALPLALLLYLIVGQNLLRALLQLAVVALAVGPAVPRLLHVYSAVVDGRGYAAALASASAWVGASALVAGAGSGVVAVLDRRVRVPARIHVPLRRATLAAAAAAAAAAVVVTIVAGQPVTRTRQAWHDFTTNKKASPQTIHIVSGLGSSRYDIWRISLRQFREHPLGGVGADNFLVGYLEQRRTSETARYPESVELRALSETGAVGAVLCIGFLLTALRRAVTASRRDPFPGAALACLVGCGYWLFHASIDWFWEFPALTAPAFALLAVAGGSVAHGRGDQRPNVHAGHRARRSILAGTTLLAAAAATALAAPWVAVRQIDEAVAVAATNPNRSYALLRDAARLNPLSDAAALTEATLAANAGDRVRERRALRAALRRNGSDWYAYLMLGIVAGQEHRLAASRTNLAQARRLSPADPLVIYAQRRLKWGTPLTEREVGSILRLITRTLRGVEQG